MNLNNILIKLETVKFIMIFIFINFAFSQDIVFITESDDPSAVFGGMIAVNNNNLFRMLGMMI